jgi:hypothetical protein
MMSCALCSKWQHILCHNKRDQAAGHPTRNWDSVEFICQRCRDYQLDGSGADSLTTKQRSMQRSGTLQAALYTIPDARRPSGSFQRGADGPFRGSYDRRPNGMDQSLSAQGHFLSPALFPASDIYDPPLASTPRQMVSFNHYQPTEDGFSSSSQKAYRADSHHVYGNQQQQQHHHHTSLRCYL